MSDSTPFDFFRQEASHPDVNVRADAMNKLLVIISLMSPDKVRSDMVPYLLTKTEDLDQVLLAMAKRIGDFIPYIGGSNHAKVLLPLLENLCNAEETQVRTAAGLSVGKVLKCLGPEHKSVTREYLEMYKRLVIDDGGEVFYGRVSACQIAPQLYNTLQDQGDKTAVKEAFAKLSVDELSIIRRACCAAIMEFAGFADIDLKCGELLALLKAMVNDECSSVKIMAVELLPAYSKMLYEMKAFDVIVSEIAPLIKLAAEDPSWRVKCAVSKEFGVYASVFPQENVLIIYRSGITLMSDDEPEVRQLIIPQIFSYQPFVGLEQFLMPLIPMVQLLFDDPVPEVRRAVAALVVDTAIATGAEAMANQIADIVMKMLADEDGQTRLALLMKLSRVAEEVPNLLTRITSVIKTLYNDNNWRVRKAIVNGMPSIIGAMGPEYFQNHFLAEYLHALKDGVSEVRIAVGETFPLMIESATSEWFFNNIFTTIKLSCKEEYLIRLSIIGGLRAILRASNYISETHQGEILVYILGFTKDSVPNIRLRAAQALASICSDGNTDNSKIQLIKPVLTELQGDKDKDVKFFASTALLNRKAAEMNGAGVKS